VFLLCYTLAFGESLQKEAAVAPSNSLAIAKNVAPQIDNPGQKGVLILSIVPDHQVSVPDGAGDTNTGVFAKPAPNVPASAKGSNSPEMPLVISNDLKYVAPEIATPVEFSSSDINRIVCSGEVSDVVFSKEKGLSVKTSGKDIYLKFLIAKKADGSNGFSATPTEVFIVCGGNTYNLIAVPKRIPAQTIRLSGNVTEKIEKNKSLYEGMPLEKKVMSLIKAVYKDIIPASFSVENVKKSVVIFKDLKLTLNRIVKVEGEGYEVKEYTAEVTGDTGIELREKDFLNTVISMNPVAIMIDKLKLRKGEVARILVVEAGRS